MAEDIKKATSITELATLIAEDENVEKAFKNNPQDAIIQFGNIGVSAKASNLVYFGSLIFLGFILVIVVFAVVLLSLNDQDIPQVLVAIGSGGIGALAGVLAPSPREGVTE